MDERQLPMWQILIQRPDGMRRYYRFHTDADAAEKGARLCLHYEAPGSFIAGVRKLTAVEEHGYITRGVEPETPAPAAIILRAPFTEERRKHPQEGETLLPAGTVLAVESVEEPGTDFELFCVPMGGKIWGIPGYLVGRRLYVQGVKDD